MLAVMELAWQWVSQEKVLMQFSLSSSLENIGTLQDVVLPLFLV